jgi:DNA polymerase III delta prime subunit
MPFNFSVENLAQSNLIILPMSQWQPVLAELAATFHAGDVWQASDWEKPLPVKELRAVHDFAAQTAVEKGKLIAIPHADTMQREAANTLLKLLEEPPPGVILILFAETDHVLPTIRSRVRLHHSAPTQTVSESTHDNWRRVLNGHIIEDAEQRAAAHRLLYYSPLLHTTVQAEIIFEAFQPNTTV